MKCNANYFRVKLSDPQSEEQKPLTLIHCNLLALIQSSPFNAHFNY